MKRQIAIEKAVNWWDDIDTELENRILMDKYGVAKHLHWSTLLDETILRIYLGEHPDLKIDCELSEVEKLKSQINALAESHRELVEIVERLRSGRGWDMEQTQTALSNAKKLTNETE